MASVKLRQLKLILWKNYLLRKRHKVRIIMEFAWPLFLFFVLVYVRNSIEKYGEPNCHFAERALPSSVNGFEFIHNFVCSLNNTCQKTEKDVENLDHRTWDNALMIKVVQEAMPHMLKITKSNSSMSTLNYLKNNLPLFAQLVKNKKDENKGVLRRMSKSPTKLKSLLPEINLEGILYVYFNRTGWFERSIMDNRMYFIKYTKSMFADILQKDILINNINYDVYEKFVRGDCNFLKKNANNYLQGTSKPRLDKNGLIIPNSGSLENATYYFEKLCQTPKDAYNFVNILNYYTSKLDKDSVGFQFAKKLKNTKLKQELQPIDFVPDFKVFEKLEKLISVFEKHYKHLKSISPTFEHNGSFPFYEVSCGIKLDDSATFGLDNKEKSNLEQLRESLKGWKRNDAYLNESAISKDCNDIFHAYETFSSSRLFWKLIKPFIRGRIYYSPKNSFTNAIMKKVSEKYGEIVGLEVSLNRFADLLHQFQQSIPILKKNLPLIKDALSDLKAMKAVLKDYELGDYSEEEIKKYSDKILKVVDIEDHQYSRVGQLFRRLDNRYIEVYSELCSCINRKNLTTGFATEFEAEKDADKLLRFNVIWAVVAFTNLNKDGTPKKYVKYKIRMDTDKVDSTSKIMDNFLGYGPRRRPAFDMKYFTSGFLYLQEMIDHSIIEYFTSKNSTKDLAIYFQQFPYPCHLSDPFLAAISKTFPLLMVLSWVYASAMIVKAIVLEKELGLREVMKVMGLSDSIIWFGWFLDSFIVMFLSAFFLTIILKFGKIIQFVDFGLLFFFMLSFTIATIAFSFLVSAFFQKANSAAAAGGMLFFIAYLPYTCMLLWEENLVFYQIILGCLISNVAFAFGCDFLIRLEDDGIGATWGRVGMKLFDNHDFNLGYCILMLWIDSLLYFFFAWYFEQVLHGQKGYLFIFKKSFWQKAKKQDQSKTAQKIDFDEDGKQLKIEKHPEGFKKGIVIENLAKTYPNGKVALKNLNIIFFKSQITAFLGRNGAGKSTTMNILTGLIHPTSGTAYINGLDIRKDMKEIRKDLGYCPQFNVLFEKLTVLEHLKFFAGLKKEKYPKEEIEEMIKNLNIPPNSFPKSMSGGMRRKLCVGMAFIGGSTIIFLDEPSASIDPYSRRSIWELLIKYKADRTIILSTHFMDEAEILGDRIGVISGGKLKAMGTSLYLKANFGRGYLLRIVMDLAEEERKSRKSQKAEGSKSMTRVSVQNGKIIRSFVRETVQGANVSELIGHEVVLLLPYQSVNLFPKLFRRLDDNLARLRILSYGISDTTLENVFMKIVKTKDEEQSRMKEELTCCQKFINCLCCNCLKKKKQKKIDETLAPRTIRSSSPGSAYSSRKKSEPARKKSSKDDRKSSSKSADRKGSGKDDRKGSGKEGRKGSGKAERKASSKSNRKDSGKTKSKKSSGALSLTFNESDFSDPNSSKSEKSTKTGRSSKSEGSNQSGKSTKTGSSSKSEGSNKSGKSNKSGRSSKSRALSSEVNLRSSDESDLTIEGADSPRSSRPTSIPRFSSKELIAENSFEFENKIKLEEYKKEHRCCQLGLMQFKAILIKRFKNSRRNGKAIFFEIILPVLFILITLSLTLIVPPLTNEEPLEIKLQHYPKYESTFVSEDSSDEYDYGPLVEELTGPAGLGIAGVKKTNKREKQTRTKRDSNQNVWSKKGAKDFHKKRMNMSEGKLADCSCEPKVMTCPKEIEITKPLMFKMATNDSLIDLTPFNLSQWVLKTYKINEDKIIGGFELKKRTFKQTNLTHFINLSHELKNAFPYINKDAIGNESTSTKGPKIRTKAGVEPKLGIEDDEDDLIYKGSRKGIKIWFENRYWISSTAYLNALNNAILRANIKDPKEKAKYGISVTNHPLNLTEYQKNRGVLRTTFVGVIHAICVIFALSFIPASFTVCLIEERKCGGKHLHLISGVKPVTYWLSNFIFDMLKFMFAVFLVLMVFLIFQAEAYTHRNSILPFIFLLILFGWAAIPLMYPFSRVFGHPSTAFVVLACANLFLGIITTVTIFVLDLFDDDKINHAKWAMMDFFLLFPHYCLGRGLTILVKISFEQDTVLSTFAEGGAAKEETNMVKYFAWEFLGKLHFCLFLQGILLFIFNLLNEYTQFLNICFKYLRKCCKCRKKPVAPMKENYKEDIDVARERNRILAMSGNKDEVEDILVAKDLTKYYKGKKFPAVYKLCFGVNYECFGLLGINGAGKSTTFKMLTGDVKISSGHAKIANCDIEKSLDSARKHFGYCPQEDGLDIHLTANEHLKLYGALKGMSKKDREATVKNLLESFDLAKDANKKCGTLSGGNKRKVSACIALIGNPDVIFLDEPSTGMDAGSRRNLWQLILELVRNGKSVVLTSHSMEECEALCNRVAIMVNGNFKCMGSLQHLKNRFGSGYMLTVRCQLSKQNALIRILSDSIPKAKLEDTHFTQMKFSIPQTNVRLGDIFNTMHTSKVRGVIEDFSLSQTTLDDIFVKFAMLQKDDIDRK